MRTASVLILIMLSACAATQPQIASSTDQADLQRQLNQEATANTQLETNEWAIQLIAAIARNWAWPPGTNPTWRTFAKFQLDPTGTIQSAEVVHSSGNQVFDDSVIRAIYKASPLPLPRDPRVFDPRITACFSPSPKNCQ